MSSAPQILTDCGRALSEPKTAGAQGSTQVLAASSLGSSLVFVSSAVMTVALAAIGRDMRLSPLDLQWVMNAELLPLAALTLVAGALGDRFGQKRIFLAGIALFGLGAVAIGFAPSLASLIAGPPEARPTDGLAVDFVVEADRAQLSEIAQRVRDGRLQTNIGNVATLDEAVATFNSTARRPGKTIVRVRP